MTMRMKAQEKAVALERVKEFAVDSFNEIGGDSPADYIIEEQVKDIAIEVVANTRALATGEVQLSEAVINDIAREAAEHFQSVVTSVDGVIEEEPEPNLDPESRTCLCGCGKIVKRKRLFRQGHDAKLNSILKKVEEGELDESAIPKEARKVLVPCQCCGRLILPHESGKGPVCRTGNCRCIKLA